MLALEGGQAKPLVPGEERPSPELVQALIRKRLTPAMQAHLGIAGMPAAAVPRKPSPKRSARRRSKKAAAES